VRDASVEEADVVGALLVRAYEHAWGPSGWADYRAELLDVAGRSARCETIVVIDEGAVVGSVTLVEPSSTMRQVTDPEALEVRMLAVDPSEQRRGIARLLIGTCSGRGRDRGFARLVLQSDEDLLAAHRLYAAMGFVRREDLDVKVGGDHRALGYELDLS